MVLNWEKDNINHVLCLATNLWAWCNKHCGEELRFRDVPRLFGQPKKNILIGNVSFKKDKNGGSGLGKKKKNSSGIGWNNWENGKGGNSQKQGSSDDCWHFGRDFKVILHSSVTYLGGFLSLLRLMYLWYIQESKRWVRRVKVNDGVSRNRIRSLKELSDI